MSSDATAPAQVEMVDLFAGPGGLDVAARWLGVSAVGVELDPNACMTRRAAGLRTVQADVRDLGPADFPGATVLAGGPPCQTYSVAGSGAGRDALEQVLSFVHRMAAGEDVKGDLAHLSDERSGLVVEPLRWALEAIRLGCPYEAIVLEQVPTVKPVWTAVGKVLKANGYEVITNVLRSEEYGVPQTRRRAILIACLDRKPKLPKITHRRYEKQRSRHAGDTDLQPWEPMAKAVSRVGASVVISNYGTGGVPEERGRRRWNEPAATVTGKVRRNRIVTKDGRDLSRLEPYEAGLLQTFPIDYPWSGKDVYQQIGNAIPPRLAAHVLCEAIYNQSPEEPGLQEAVRGTWVDAKGSAFRLKPASGLVGAAHVSPEKSNALPFDENLAVISA